MKESFSTPKYYEESLFPEQLTDQDKELIIRQCEIQGATENKDIKGFATAYAEAKQLAAQQNQRLDTLTEEALREYILRWGAHIEEQNVKGFRNTEVSFADGSRGVDAAKVPRAMESFVQGYTEALKNKFVAEEDDPRPPLTPDDFYREFELIHPFKDGNGRVGDLLWKLGVTRQTGDWPDELPPNLFGEQR